MDPDSQEWINDDAASVEEECFFAEWARRDIALKNMPTVGEEFGPW